MMKILRESRANKSGFQEKANVSMVSHKSGERFAMFLILIKDFLLHKFRKELKINTKFCIHSSRGSLRVPEIY